MVISYRSDYSYALQYYNPTIKLLSCNFRFFSVNTKGPIINWSTLIVCLFTTWTISTARQAMVVGKYTYVHIQCDFYLFKRKKIVSPLRYFDFLKGTAHSKNTNLYIFSLTQRNRMKPILLPYEEPFRSNC